MPEALNKAIAEQPIPKGKGNKILPLLIKDLQSRTEEGIKRYGESLTSFNGRNAMQDAFQEVLDLAQYLRQVLEEWPPQNIEEGSIGWVAGIIDGEGSICVGISQTGRFYQPSLQIVNTDLKLLQKVQRITKEGKIYTKKPQKDRLQTYSLVMSIKPAAKVLRTVLPYLVTKKEQAEAFIQLDILRTSRNSSPNVTNEEWELVEKISSLKLGGRKGKNKKHTSKIKEWSKNDNL